MESDSISAENSRSYTCRFRTLQRTLILVIELGICGSAVVPSIALMVWLDSFDRELDQDIGPLLLMGAVFIGLVAAFIFRGAIVQWKIGYDAAGWELDRAGRARHPVRARYKRFAVRILVWVPSAVAALAMLFFPVATHVVHPGSKYLEHYRFRIPWTSTVFPSEGWGSDLASVIRSARTAYYNGFDVVISSSGRGRFGITPFLVPPLWSTEQPISDITFGPAPNTAVLQTEWFEARYGSPTQIRGFRLGRVELTCWQYRRLDRSLIWPYNALIWHVYCATPTGAGPQSFEATFDGRDEDLAIFYHMIDGVTPIP